LNDFFAEERTSNSQETVWSERVAGY